MKGKQVNLLENYHSVFQAIATQKYTHSLQNGRYKISDKLLLGCVLIQLLQQGLDRRNCTISWNRFSVWRTSQVFEKHGLGNKNKLDAGSFDRNPAQLIYSI